MKKIILVMAVTTSIATFSQNQKMEPLAYPETKKTATVDTYFGTEVNDPYRWLEDDKSDETAAWVKDCLLYTSPSPRDRTRSRMPSSA